VLELILTSICLSVPCFIIQILRMMNYRKRLTLPSLFMAILGEVADPASFAANSSRAHVPVYTRCFETSLCLGLAHHRPNSEATVKRLQLYSTFTCPVKHETTLNLFVKNSCSCFKGCFFRILYHFLSLVFMFLFLPKYILHRFHCCP
jgi:hypothetical protein